MLTESGVYRPALRGRFTLTAALLLGIAIPAQMRAQSPAPPPPPGWQAQWIAARFAPDKDGRMPIFRYAFDLHKAVSKATLRISGLGQFEAHINGQNVTDAILTPGWTDYRKRVFYDSYDVTPLLAPGKNAIGVLLGRGMYDVRQTEGRYTKFTGSFGQPKLIAELHLLYTDGTQETFASSQNWKTAPGPITFSSAYGGEDFDARLEQPGWDGAVFDASTWSSAAIVAGPGGKLVPETIPPVKAFQQFEPVAVTHPAAGVAVYDMGQNFAGWPEIEVLGARGAQIKLLAGELLDAHGFVTQRSTGASPEAENAFTYVLKGGGLERWHPRFSYWGFRYVQADGDAAIIHHLDGRFLHDAVDMDGSFTTSDEEFNRIHALINRAMLSNMYSVLTDCPHREKLGWLEQTHLAGPSLMYNYNLAALYAKIADDMQDAQLPNGLVPSIAPEFPVFEGAFRDSPEWGAADILSTWTAYQFYGDRQQLQKHYDSMARYLAYLKGRTENHLLTYGLGDWYDIGPGDPGPSKLTAKGITATGLYYQALTRMVRIAGLTGHSEDVAAYAQEAGLVKAAFNQTYFHSDTNQYDRGSQTADALPLVVGLVAEDHRAAVLENLVKDIRKHANHVTAGDIGYHYVVRALTDGYRSDVLYDMLSRMDAPSYGDQLAHGATSLTEAWDANPDSSQNHFMLGHAEEWFYRGLAGIDFDLTRDRDQRILIHPAVVGAIRDVKATYHSKLGEIESGWTLNGNRLRMIVVVPKGSTATVTIPSGFNRDARLNGQPLKTGGSVLSITLSRGSAQCVLAGGRFVLEASRGTASLSARGPRAD